jgi:hypothetical protein
MSQSQPALGKLIDAHPTAPSHLQRAAIVAGLSFVFFLATLIIFYQQQSIGYFVLSTAFLVVYIFTLIGWVMQKRNVVTIYENGIAYRKFAATWDDIKSVTADSGSGITVVKSDGHSVVIGKSVSGLNQIASTIREHLP